jgi:hypothetical protein
MEIKVLLIIVLVVVKVEGKIITIFYVLMINFALDIKLFLIRMQKVLMVLKELVMNKYFLRKISCGMNDHFHLKYIRINI